MSQFCGSVTLTIPASEGPWVAAYRFVNPATGQSTTIVTLPDVILVPAASVRAA